MFLSFNAAAGLSVAMNCKAGRQKEKGIKTEKKGEGLI